MRERALWPKYQKAFQEALRATSTDWAPWYAIQADDKPFMRQQVAEIIRRTLEGLNLQYPKVSAEERGEMQRLRAHLVDG